MNHRYKLIISLILIAIIIAGGTYLFLEKQGKTSLEDLSTVTKHKPFTYGTFEGYFTGQDSIIYPLIFDTIYTINDPKDQEIKFGPQDFEGFEISMNVARTSKQDAEGLKAELIKRGFVSEGPRTTLSGYEGEIVSSNSKGHPNENSQACSFHYFYFIPLAESSNYWELAIDVSQLAFAPCTIFDDQNYLYLKDMVNHVINNIQPAF